MSKINLSKSEKNLIFILTIVLIIFFYFTFIRIEENPKIENYTSGEMLSAYESLKENYSKVLEENENLIIYEKYADENFKNFGKLQNLYSELKTEEIEIVNYTINKPANLDFDGIEISVIDSKLSIQGEIKNIKKFLEKIEKLSFVEVKSLSVSRIDKKNFNANIFLEESSMIPIPYNGIKIEESKFGESSKSSLMDALYSEEKTEEIKEENLETEIVKENKPTNELQNTSKKDLNFKPITSESYYKNIETKEKELIKNSYLKEYENMNVQFVFDSEFFSENEKQIEKDKKVENAIDYDDNTGIVTVNVNDKLKLEDLDLKIEAPSDFYIFEYNSEKNSTIGIGFKAADGTYLNFGENAEESGWKKYKFEIPKDEKLYPLKIESIYVYGEGENENVKIRNFAKINEN